MASSKQFLRIYRTLPPESQQAFVEEHLAPLLDTLSTKKRARIIRDAKHAQTRYNDIPNLDLNGKKREIQTLLTMLAKDDKVAFTRDRSNREEILQELVHSLSSWMNKIWTTAYVYKIHFDQVHECLLYALRSLALLEDSPSLGDCKCLYKNMHVAISLKNEDCRTVKYFSFVGPHRLDEVYLWIWRDLFLIMLMEDRNSKGRVREMLGDIENIMGWRGLERVLRGGNRKSSLDDDDDDNYDGDDFLDEEEDFLREYEDVGTDEEIDSDDDTDGCCCSFHAKYWPDHMDEERIKLREIVKSCLINIFRDTPDAELFNVIGVISQDPTSRTTNQLLRMLSDAEGDGVDSFKAALNIHTELYHPWKILQLLESHYDYLLLSDFTSLIPAIAVLVNSPSRPQALKYAEREFFDSIQHIYVAIRSAFSHFADGSNKTDLVEILKLPLDSPIRKTRIEGWVDRSLTSNRPEHVGPMAFAAMMMGLPVGPPPSALDEEDFLAYIDLNKPDPDLDDLREEFRPPLKDRFEQWYFFIQTTVKDCPPILNRAYAKVIELMPFFRSNDIVSSMLARLGDRPNKGHIHDAMASVAVFCKEYRERRAKKRHPIPKRTASKSNGNSTVRQTPTVNPGGNSTPVGNNPSLGGSSTTPAFGLNPPPPPPPAGPIFHVFTAPLGNPGAATSVPLFGTQGNNSAPATNNTPAPPGPPPECNHQ